jgi:hypothetical protein
MYAFLFIWIFIGLWLVLITKLLVNARRENQIKQNNQKYYTQKLNRLYEQERDRQGEKDKEV